MTKLIYKPLADGVYEHKGSIISVGRGNNLAVSEKKPRMKIWVGELPDGWRLCEAIQLPAPDWSRAPDWAEWWAVSVDGWQTWCEVELGMIPAFGEWGAPESAQIVHDGMIEIPLGVDWRLLKVQRPKDGIDGNAPTEL